MTRLALLLLPLLAAVPARAEEAPKAPAPPEAAPAPVPAAPKWTEELTVNAFVSASYLYNLNAPDSRKNALRIFDSDHNTFSLGTVLVVLQRPVSAPGDAGFRADFDLGGVIAPRSASSGELPGNFGLRQGFLSYVAPLGSGLRLDVGKFITMAGFEYIETFDNPNDNASRSLLFNYAIPFTHTGVQATYVFSPKLKAVVHLVNGWDNALSLTAGKTACGQLNVTPTEALSLYFNYCGGVEKVGVTAALPAGRDEVRQLVDFNGTLKAASWLTLGLNGDLGIESVTGGSAARWYGAAVYLKAEAAAGYGVALRGEWFKDEGGTRLPVAGSVVEATVTPYYRLSSHFTVRGELRLDSSSAIAFDKGAGTSTTQPTLALNTLFTY